MSLLALLAALPGLAGPPAIPEDPPGALPREALKRSGPSPAAPGAPTGWDFLDYDIAISLDPIGETASGRMAAHVECTDPSDPIVLHARRPVEIAVIRLDGAVVAWTRSGDELRVAAPDGTNPGDVVVVEAEWVTTGTRHPDELGLHWGSPTWTLSEPDGARTWLVVHDDPADKATLTWHVTAPSTWTVIANGNLVGTTDPGFGSTTWDWEFPWPIATYLMVVDLGAFVPQTLDEGPVPYTTWAYPDDLGRAAADLGNTPDMIAFLSDLWFPYPYDTYANVIVPMGGAMEHTTATSYGETFLGGGWAEFANVHELAHQWWGDWVTCATWADIWLNEGFASYTEALWYERYLGEEGLAEYLESQRESYLGWHAWEGVFALYDPFYMWGGTVYDKGSWVVHMLRGVLGDEAFFGALRDYGAARGGGVATTADLEADLEASTGLDLGWFFDAWVYQAGDPEYVVGLTQRKAAEGLWQVDVHVLQTAAGEWPMPVEWRIDLQDGSTVEDIRWMEGREGTFTSCLPARATDFAFSPHARLLYASLAYDDARFEPAPDACTPTDTGDTAAPPDDTAAPPDDTAASGESSGGGCGCGLRPRPRPGGALPALVLAALLPILRRRARPAVRPPAGRRDRGPGCAGRSSGAAGRRPSPPRRGAGGTPGRRPASGPGPRSSWSTRTCRRSPPAG